MASASDLYPDIATIKAALLKGSYISEEDNKAAEAAANNSSEGYIDYLVRSQLLDRTLLIKALAEGYNLPYMDLQKHPVTKEQITAIPEDFARSNHVVFVASNGNNVAVACYTPQQLNRQALDALLPGKKVYLYYAAPEQIVAAYTLYERPLETRFSEIITSGKRVAPEIVDEIIKDALSYHASDIHFEPEREQVLVRFRVDGNLRAAGRLPKEHFENILNRIKVESGMRIDEHFSAQDGSMRRQLENNMVDLRVSLVPTVEGEKVVMRVLGSYIRSFELTDIGMSDRDLAIMNAQAAKPFGMILTVGPTGSGKTTTLYSLLKMLNRPDVNITSIEDPVEYKIAGVNQIQVREQTDLTFAKGLRSIVRQDPDVILVGEIRDQETADVAVNAALTGHLLLSTFHANDASTVVPRLIDMGIEPFLLASTLEVVIAQRLVRKLCTNCRYSLPAIEAVKTLTGRPLQAAGFLRRSDTVYAGKGCNVCNGSGFNGRSALYEIIEITPEMEELITKSPSARDIAALAKQQGAWPMFYDGLEKVRSGITTISEMARVVEPPKLKQVGQV